MNGLADRLQSIFWPSKQAEKQEFTDISTTQVPPDNNSSLGPSEQKPANIPPPQGSATMSSRSKYTK